MAQSGALEALLSATVEENDEHRGQLLRESVGLVMHELMAPLAQMGSAAEKAILAARRLVRELDEGSPARDAADMELERLDAQVSEARQRIGALVTLVPALVSVGRAELGLMLTECDVVSLVTGELHGLQGRDIVRWSCASTAAVPARLVCDSTLLGVAARGILQAALDFAVAPSGEGVAVPRISLQSRVTADRVEFEVCSIRGSTDAALGALPSGPPVARWDRALIGILVATRVLEAHGGALRSERNGAGEYVLVAHISTRLKAGAYCHRFGHTTRL